MKTKQEESPERHAQRVEAGRKGGLIGGARVSADRAHMSAIGRLARGKPKPPRRKRVLDEDGVQIAALAERSGISTAEAEGYWLMAEPGVSVGLGGRGRKR